MGYDIVVVTAIGCRIMDAEISTSWSRTCADAGLIIVGEGWVALFTVLAVMQFCLGCVWIWSGESPLWCNSVSAKVMPALVATRAPFRQELSQYREYGMSELQDLVCGDAARSALPYIVSLLMFDGMFVPTVYAACATFVCDREGNLVVTMPKQIECWEGEHLGFVVVGVLMLVWVTAGGSLHWLYFKNEVTLWLRQTERVEILHVLTKTGMPILVLWQYRHPSARSTVAVAYTILVTLLLALSVAIPSYSEIHGPVASSLRVAGLCGCLVVAVLAMAAVLADQPADVPEQLLIVYPVLVLALHQLFQNSSRWRSWVGQSTNREIELVLPAVREDPSELHLLQLEQFLDSKRPLGQSGTLKLASELRKGKWNLASLALPLHGIGAGEALELATALSSPSCVVRELNLMGNRIGDDGVKLMAQVLPVSSLTCL